MNPTKGKVRKAHFDPAEARDEAGRWIRVFAYGTNLEPDLMGMRAPGAVLLGRARLAGHRLEPGGPPNVRQDANSSVAGVVYAVPAGSMASLDRTEGVAHGLYDRVDLPVQTDRGQRTAVVYRMPDHSRHPGYGMSAYLARWYRHHGLDPNEIPGLSEKAVRPTPIGKVWRPDLHPRDPLTGRFVVIVGGRLSSEPGYDADTAARRIAGARLRGETQVEVRRVVGANGQWQLLTPTETRAIADRAARLIASGWRPAELGQDTLDGMMRRRP